MTPLQLEKRFFPEAIEDIKALPSKRLQEIVLGLIVQIAKQQRQGALLDSRVHTGDLSDCRKEYFDETGGPRPGWRLVFRFLPDDRQRVLVEVIAVGPRADLEVYRITAERLGRAED